MRESHNLSHWMSSVKLLMWHIQSNSNITLILKMLCQKPRCTTKMWNKKRNNNLNITTLQQNALTCHNINLRFVKHPKVRLKRPAETYCFCSRFILFAKFKGFYIFNLTNILLIKLTIWNFCLEGWCVFSVRSHRLWWEYWQYHHSCLPIEFHLACQPCSSVCECILQAFVLQ